MSVPGKVPANVPGAAAAPAKRKRASKGSVGSLPHLTREGDGWRFQMRLPASLFADFGLAGPAPTIRASLGPRSRGEARRLGRQLAVLCEAVAAATAATQKEQKAMSTTPPGDQELVAQVIGACQNAIGQACKNPAQATGLARRLSGALTSLQLVQNEVAKGTAGARAVVDNTDALTRDVRRF